MLGRDPRHPSCSSTSCKMLGFWTSVVGCLCALYEWLWDFMSCHLTVSKQSVMSTIARLLSVLRQRLLLKVLPATALKEPSKVYMGSNVSCG